MKRFIAGVIMVLVSVTASAAVYRTSAEVPPQTFVVSPVISPGKFVSWRNIMWKNGLSTACQVWTRTGNTVLVISCIGREDTYVDLEQFPSDVNLITISP